MSVLSIIAISCGPSVSPASADILDEETNNGQLRPNVSDSHPTIHVLVPAVTDPVDPVEQCGERLLQDSRKSEREVARLLDLYRKHIVDTDPEFTQFALAVSHVESRFNTGARSTANAVGLMQMTSVAVTDAVRLCGFRPLAIERLHDPALNVRYGTCFLRLKLTEAGGDKTRALILYNGGYRQLEKFDRGLPIASETANYVIQVKRSLALCQAADSPAPVK